VVWSVDSANVRVALAGNALAHAAVNSTNFSLQFNDSAFSNVVVANIAGSAVGFTVTFFNQPGLTFSPTEFDEATANDGSIDNSNSNRISLINGTFDGINGAVFGPDKVLVSNLPSNLTAVVTLTSPTNLSVQLTGFARAHTNANTVNDLAFTFQDAAFSNVVAAHIDGSTQTGLRIVFHDQPVLTFNPTVFTEATANDGSIDNSNSNRISLIGTTFTGNNGDVFDLTKVQVSNLPSNLTAVVKLTSPTNLSVQLTGQALTNESADSVMDLGFTFKDTAFNNVVATNITGSIQSGLHILFFNATAGTVYKIR